MIYVKLSRSFALVAALTACAGAPFNEDRVPDSLRPGAGVRPLITLAASGAQIYECRAAASGATPAWAFVAPEASAIPWLLLAARSTGAAGRLSQVTHVQRIHTQGGVAPATGCAAHTLGQQARVPYRADYRLFVPA